MTEPEIPNGNLPNLEALQAAGDWSLRLLLSEGDRFWARLQHCLTSNSLMALALAAVLSSSSTHIRGWAKLIVSFALGVIGLTVNCLWLGIARRGSEWHRIYGERFQEANLQLIKTANLGIRTAHPEGVFASGMSKGEIPEAQKARGIQKRARRLIATAAVVWALVGTAAITLALLHYC